MIEEYCKREVRNRKGEMRDEKCSILPRISQIELRISKNDFFNELSNWYIKMNYKQNKEAIKEKSKKLIKTCHKKKNKILKSTKEKISRIGSL